MRPEVVPAPQRHHRGPVESFALTLLTAGAGQSVRVLEALAAALVNHARRPSGSTDPGLSEPPPANFGDAAAVRDYSQQLQLCRRVARRALGGSLADPTSGATAFHRLEGDPAWARDLLPVAAFGSFLFYQLPTLD